MDNSSTNESCIIGEWVESATVLEIFLECVIMGISMVLNILLLVAICSSYLLRTSTHIFISSLAASDIVTSLYGLIRLIIIDNLKCISLAFRHHMDRLLYLLYVIIAFSNYMNILIVSGERWLFISRPFLHQRLISLRFTLIGVTVAWASSLLVNLDGFIFSLKYYWEIAHFKSDVLLPYIHLGLTAVLCFIYIHLTVITRRQIHAIRKTDYLHPTNNNDTRHVRLTDTHMKQLRRNLRSVRLLLTVFGGFVVLLGPEIYYHFYVRLSLNKQEYPRIHEGFKLLSSIHSCVNFIVFARLDRCFRRVLRIWLRKARCQHTRCVGRVQIIISVCQRCRRGYKVGVDNSSPKVANPTSTQEEKGRMNST